MFVMILVIFNFVIFFIMFISVYSDFASLKEIYGNFAFSSNYLVGENSGIAAYEQSKIFTIFTHMYIHSYNNFFHILMNMVFLMLLGIPFEDKVGPWVFMGIYFIAGIFGSVFTALFDLIGGGGFGLNPASYGVGASGAIFGILGAFVALYPNERIMFPLIIIKKWPVWLIAGIYFGIETLIAASSPDDHVGHFAHIGGFIGGLLFVPLVNKFKTAHETARAMDTLDLTKLGKLATNYKLKDMLERIKNEDEREIQQVWLEEFMKNVKCPECKKKLTVKPGKAKCKNCGFVIRY